MSVHSEMKIPSRDGTTDMPYFCHLEIEPPKGHDYSKIQTRNDLNNSVISITKHTHLYFY